MSTKYVENAKQRAAVQVRRFLRKKPKLKPAFDLVGEGVIMHGQGARVIKNIMQEHGLEPGDLRDVLKIAQGNQQAEASRRESSNRVRVKRPSFRRGRPGVCHRPRVPVF